MWTSAKAIISMSTLWAYYHEPYQIVSGKTETTFEPMTVCTRANFVTFLWRAANKPEPENCDNPFVDVSEDSYYFKAVLWAYENGITAGVTETEFAPNADVTRGQVVAFLWRYAGRPAPNAQSVSFKDISPESPFYQAVIWASENNIVGGYDANTFGTNDGCTRAQAVTFMYRLMK